MENSIIKKNKKISLIKIVKIKIKLISRKKKKLYWLTENLIKYNFKKIRKR